MLLRLYLIASPSTGVASVPSGKNIGRPVSSSKISCSHKLTRRRDHIGNDTVPACALKDLLRKCWLLRVGDEIIDATAFHLFIFQAGTRSHLKCVVFALVHTCKLNLKLALRYRVGLIQRQSFITWNPGKWLSTSDSPDQILLVESRHI